jgi:PAS domain-containing protein
LRDDGTLFVRQPQMPQVVGRKFPEMVATASDPSGLVMHTMDQQPRFVGIANIRDFPLVVTVSRDKNTVLERWRDEAWQVGARTLALALLGAAAIVALVYQLRRVEVGERALRQSEERYALAMEGANEGHCDWTFENGASFLSPQMKRLHGRSADAPVTTRRAWFAMLEIHPDDVARIMGGRDHWGWTARYEAEYRVRHPDGEWYGCRRADAAFTMNPAKCSVLSGRRSISPRARTRGAEKERLEVSFANRSVSNGDTRWRHRARLQQYLGAILGYGELAQKAGPKAVWWAAMSITSCTRAAAPARRGILAFSRSGIGERGP